MTTNTFLQIFPDAIPRDGEEREHFDHTWNLDDQDDESQSDSENEEQQRHLINEEDVETFLEQEKQDAEKDTEQARSGVRNERRAEQTNSGVNTEQTTEQGNTGVSAELMPKMGMEFKSREDAHQFLNMYSFAAGFSIAVVSIYRTSSKKRNNEITRVTIKCNKHGHNTDAEREEIIAERQSTVIVRTDCKAEMIISEKNGIWRITKLLLEHNHHLDPGARFFRSHVHMTKEEKAIIRTMKQCNIPTRNIVSVLAHMRGGYEQLPYNKRKVCRSEERRVGKECRL